MRFNPTVALFAGVASVFAGVLAGLMLAGQPAAGPIRAGAFVLQALIIFPAYTVAHDAAHHIASRRRVVNELMLIACGVLFLFEPYLFRRLHLMHHAHTDERGKDPDLFTSGRSWPVRAARSAMLHVGYYAYALRHWWGEPRWRRHLIAAVAMPLLILAAFAAAGRTSVFLVAWVGPLLAAGAVLGFMLSSAPHDARTHTTRNLHVPMVLRWLLGNGHLHLAHHLAPTVPWYRLPAFWRRQQNRPTTTSRRRRAA
jgi:fatty acid desaturase